MSASVRVTGPADGAVRALVDYAERELAEPEPTTRPWRTGLLLRGRQRRSPAALARMRNGCVDLDTKRAILTAWIAEEPAQCARTAASGGHRKDSHADCGPSTLGAPTPTFSSRPPLAETIETWWPRVEVFLTNAHTEDITGCQTGEARRLRPQKRRFCSAVIQTLILGRRRG